MAFLHTDDDYVNLTQQMDHSMHMNHGAGGDHSMHAGMDHSAHSMHGGMDHSMMMGHSMSMAFHTGYNETILFTFWTINSTGGLVGSMIGIFLASMLYEGLKVFREYLLQKALVYEREGLANGMHHRSVNNHNGLRVPLAAENGDSPDSSAVINPPVKSNLLRPHPFSVSHIVQSFLHMFQVFVSYLLMLVFMTYNVWLALAVILGAGAGYFLFGWRKKTIVDINEHCH